MKVHLRQRKQSKTGQISLYLEIYRGTLTMPDGKNKILRDYKYLNLYLTEKPATPLERQQNKDIIKLANVIKAQTELDLKNGQHGFKSAQKSKVDFIAFFKQQAETKKSEVWLSAASMLVNFAGERLPMASITTEFCQEFKTYLEESAVTKWHQQKLLKGSAHVYFTAFKGCLNVAVTKNLINENPCSKVTSPKGIYSKREYLTIDEVKALVKSDCQSEVLKKAFLFSCLTGLRYSDIEKLTWAEVKKTDAGHQLVFYQQKTEDLSYLDISDQARNLLGETGKPYEKVFKGLYYSGEQNLRLQNWMIRAGISKKITFHSARHTFAVLQLSYGSDIYTVSKLLGHANLKTTEIYSKIVDQKKIEAANRLPDIGL